MAYQRDGRAPIPKDPRTSALMSRIRAKNTGPELTLRALLRQAGHRGYRLHHKSVPGKPDIAYISKRVAVFVHGCFWHGCPHCRPPRPKSNRSFWHAKLDANALRDQRKAKELRHAGWTVVTIWECQLRKRPQAQLARVLRHL
jgi:DNA mismatch endonuclease (patch repair protein)